MRLRTAPISHSRRAASTGLAGILSLLAATLLTSGHATSAATSADSGGVDPATVLYVAEPESGAIQKRDAATGTLLDTITLPAGVVPEQLIATPDFGAVFVRADNWLGYIDPPTNTAQPLAPTVTATYGMALSADGTQLFAEDDGDPDTTSLALLYNINVATKTVRAIPLLSTGEFATSAVAASPDGATAYVIGETFNGGAQRYLKVDTATSQLTQVPAEHVHESASVSRDGAKLYLGRVASTDRTVDAYYTATDTFTGSWAGAGETPRNALGLLPALNDDSLYVVRSAPNGGTGLVSSGIERIDGQDGAPLAAWTSGIELTGSSASQSPDGSLLYVGDAKGTVTILDAQDLTVQSTWSADTTISSVAAAIVPRAPTIVTAPAVSLTAGIPANAPIDAVGSPSPTVTVTGTLPPGVVYTPGTFGRGTLTGTPTLAGQYPVTVTAQNIHGIAEQNLTVTVTAGAPTGLAPTSGNGQSTTVGKPFANQLRAQVIDTEGNPVPTTMQVTFKVIPTGAASFAGVDSVTVATDEAGLAVSPFLTAGTTPGAVEVAASSPNLQSTAYSMTVTGTHLGGEEPLPTPTPTTHPTANPPHPSNATTTKSAQFLATTGQGSALPVMISGILLALIGVALITARRLAKRLPQPSVAISDHTAPPATSSH